MTCQLLRLRDERSLFQSRLSLGGCRALWRASRVNAQIWSRWQNATLLGGKAKIWLQSIACIRLILSH